MGVIAEIRARAAHVVMPVLGFCVVGYFAYHAVQGDRGLIAWRQLTLRVEAARAALAEIGSERRLLEHRVRLLSPGSLDLDILEERARLMLNYGYVGESVVLDDSRNARPGVAER